MKISNWRQPRPTEKAQPASSEPLTLEDNLRLLSHKKADQRKAAVMALTHYPESLELVGPALIAGLKDRHPEVKCEVIWALGRMGYEEALEPLTTLLTTKDHRIRREVAETLGVLGHKRATLPLTQAIFDPRLEVFLASIGALASLQDERCIKLLKIGAKSMDLFTRARARKALKIMGVQHDSPPDWKMAMEVVQNNGISGRQSRYSDVDLEVLLEDNLMQTKREKELSLDNLMGS